MVLTDILLKHQLEDMSYETVGFVGGDLNSTNGTAFETIEACNLVSPDLMSMPAVVAKYDFLIEFAKIASLLLLLVWLISYVIQRMDIDQYSKYESMLPFMKRGVIALVMIGSGMFMYTMLMELNFELSVLFGGSKNLLFCISGPFLGDMGCVMTGLSCTMISYLGIFYLCRYILLIIGVGIWVFGWLAWMCGVGDNSFCYKMETLGLFLLQFVILNIFMGSIMCVVFWLGVLIVDGGASLGFIGAWGGYMTGLCFVAISGIVPIIAFIWLFKNPRYVVYRMTGGMV